MTYVVVNLKGEFLSTIVGIRWHAEYPDAQQFTNFHRAASAAKKNGGQVVVDYGLESQESLTEMYPAPNVKRYGQTETTIAMAERIVQHADATQICTLIQTLQRVQSFINSGRLQGYSGESGDIERLLAHDLNI